MKKTLWQITLMGAALTLGAENAFFNGSFELGTDGVAIRRQLRADTNPKFEFLPPALGPAAPGEGKNSLLIRNPNCEPTHLFFREIELKPDTDYVLEFKGRCSAGTQSGRLHLTRVRITKLDALEWNTCNLNFVLTPEWKTFRRTINTKEKRIDGFTFPEFIFDKQKTPADFYLDGFKVYEAKTAPAESVNVAVTTQDFVTVADKTAKVPATVKIGNFSARKFAEKVTVSACNDWDGKTYTKTLAVELAPGEVKSFPVEFELCYGCWSLGAAAPGIRPTAVLNGSIAVVGKYEAKKLDFSRDFCINLNGSLDYNGFPAYPQFGYEVKNAAIEKNFEYLSKMGCRMLRDHDRYPVTSWYVMEPEEGKFDFRHFDYCMKMYEKYNIECFVCLGDSWFLRARPYETAWKYKDWPDWLQKRCYPVEFASYNWRGTKGYGFLPPMDAWRKFARTVATHGKGRLHYYEIFNEPNGVMSAKSYVPVMKAAYEEIKKVDRDAKVIGICVTEDFGAQTAGFVNEVLDLKGGDYFDYASFHPYTSRELGSPNPADKLIREFRETLKQKTGRDVPLWNTELYYLYDTQSRNGSNEGDVRPNHVALRLLTDLGEGVVQSSCINTNQILKCRLIPHHGFRTKIELVPNFNFVVNNAIARFFEAARVTGKYRPGSGVAAYSFRKDGHGVAAIWNFERRKGVSADLTNFAVFDMFGNELKSGLLPITDAPYYLRPGKNMSDEAFFAAVKELKIAVERPVLVSNQVRMAGNRIFATLINQTGKVQSGFLGFRGNKCVSAKTLSFRLQPGERRNVVLPLKENAKSQKEEFTIYINKQLMSNPVSVVREECVKGGETQTMTGKDGFSGSWKMTKKDGILTLVMHVNDATDSGKDNKNNIWDQDCIELFFDFDPLSLPLNHADAYTPGVVRFFLLPRLAKEKQLQVWSKEKLDAKASFKVAPGGYDVEFSLPCKADVVGFSIKFNDAKPGAKAHADLRFAAGKDAHLNRLHFNLVELK